MREVPISYCLLKKGEGGFKRGVLTKKSLQGKHQYFRFTQKICVEDFLFFFFFSSFFFFTDMLIE